MGSTGSQGGRFGAPTPSPGEADTESQDAELTSLSAGSGLRIEGLADIRMIGSGASSTVYQASDLRFKRQVAVKVANSADPTFHRRFERERVLLGRLGGHPHVIVPFQYGLTEDDRPYTVLEYASGGSLQDQLDAHRRFTPQESVRVVLEIADALGSVHDAGILHRDVKPSNILIADNGAVKLADFGAAHGNATATSLPFTLAYSAPETFAVGMDAGDERADLYSLGATFFTLLTGRPPYAITGNDSPAAMMKRTIEAPIPPCGVADFDRFFTAALAKDPAQRPRTATEFSTALREVAGLPQLPRTNAPTKNDEGTEFGATEELPVVTPSPIASFEEANTVVAAPYGASEAGTVVADKQGTRGRLSVVMAAAAVVVAMGMGAFFLRSTLTGDDPGSSEASSSDQTSQPTSTDTSESTEADPGNDDSEATDAAPGNDDLVAAESEVEGDGPVPTTKQLRLDVETSSAEALAALDDGRLAIAGTEGVTVWSPDVDSVEVFALHGVNGSRAVDVLADGRLVSFGFRDLLIWSADEPTTYETKLPTSSVTFFEADPTDPDWLPIVEPLADGRLASYTPGLMEVWDPRALGLDNLDDVGDSVGVSSEYGIRSIEELGDGRVMTVSNDERGFSRVVYATYDQMLGAYLTGRTIDPSIGTAEVVIGERPLCAALALDDGQVAFGTCDGGLSIQPIGEPADDQVVFPTIGGTVTDLAELADGRLVVSGDDGTVVIVDRSGGTLELSGHVGPVHSVAVLADNRVATAGDDGTVRIWEVPSTDEKGS